MIFWDTDFMGYARFEAQMAKAGNSNFAGYGLFFVVLVVFTIIFIFTYLKRVLYMAFLTLIAPLVAMTYPIDKIHDGQAQAFNMWLKEYIFNLLIQPLHLLLYTILITSAFDLASKNIVYALVALGFMMPAEKLMRKFFGFEKAQTPGMLGGAAGAALMMAGMNKLLSHKPKGGHGDSGKSGGSGSGGEKEDTNINTKDNFDAEGAFGEENGDDNNPLQQMYDQDEEDFDFLNADMDQRQEMDNNYRDAYGYDTENNNPTDEDMRANLAESGFSEEEINALLGEPPQSPQPSQDDVQDNVSDPQNNDTKTKRSFGRGFGRAARYYGRGMIKSVGNGISNAHLGRKTLRLAGGAALGVATGALGLAAGIASGDPSKAFQYTAAAGFGGYKMGSGTVKAVDNALDVKGTGDVFEKEYLRKRKI